jgi:hypothetical protein
VICSNALKYNHSEKAENGLNGTFNIIVGD